MFRTLASIIGRSLALWRAERLLGDPELKQYAEFLNVASNIGFNDRGNVLVRLTTEHGDQIEIEVSTDIIDPGYTVYAVTAGGYRHIVWCNSSAAGAAAATAATVDMAVYRHLFATTAVG